MASGNASLAATKLGGNQAAIGRSITLTGNTYTIAGVMPAGFRFPSGYAEIWVPFRAGYRQKSEQLIQVVAIAHARRKPGYWRNRT